MSKISVLASLSSPATNDLFPVVDVSDTSMASSGTTKQISFANLLSSVLPLSQTTMLSNLTYKDIYTFTVTGQTDDPLPPFGQVTGSQTYSFPPNSGSRAVQGPAVWTGYNPRKLSGQTGLSAAENAHAALGMAWFADAGDSNNNAGGHGLEFSIGCFYSPNGSVATNSIEIVALDDNTNTVYTAFRCGNGQYTGPTGVVVSSGISFSDAGGGTYLTLGPYSGQGGTGPGIQTNNPLISSNLTSWGATSPAAMALAFTSVNDATIHLRSTTGKTSLTLSSDASATGQTASLFLNGNASSGSSGTLAFQKANANTWVFQESSSVNLYVINNSGNVHALFSSGTNTAGNYNNASTFFLTKTLVYGSMIVNNGGSALATTATDGFLYIPTCAGTPTGTPTTQAGAVALIMDITNNRLYTYNSGWKAVTVS